MEKVIQDFSKYIQKRFGIITDTKSNKQLEKFVLDNSKLLSLPNWQEELDKIDLSNFLNSITITETYFFRDRKQLNVLVEDIRKKVKQSEEKLKFNIWSMGCSSGEEPYTISILLKEAQNNLKFEYNIKGFDLNSKNIEKANKGNYTTWSFRGLDNNLLIPKYFKQEEDTTFTLSQVIKENVSFNKFNITEDLFDPKLISKYGVPDYVLLRNTIMYFNHDTVAKIVSKIYELLPNEGMLIPGIQEVRIFKLGNISANYIEDTCVFIKNEQNKTKVKIPPIKELNKIETKSNITKLLQSKISNSKIQVKYFVKAIKQRKEVEKVLDYKDLIKASIKSFEKGNIEEALNFCTKAEPFPESNYVLYYLRSAIFFEIDELEESLKNIRKALFLNSESALNHYYAAKIMIKKDDYRKAILHLNKALLFIEKDDENESLNLLGLSIEDVKKHINIAFKVLEVKNDKL